MSVPVSVPASALVPVAVPVSAPIQGPGPGPGQGQGQGQGQGGGQPAGLQKLELFLRIYFAIYPIHPSNPARGDSARAAEEMQLLKEYLETKGVQLAKIPEFVPFYALPYIKNPSVRTLFMA